jgi:hypothetical protein
MSTIEVPLQPGVTAVTHRIRERSRMSWQAYLKKVAQWRTQDPTHRLPMREHDAMACGLA